MQFILHTGKLLIEEYSIILL